MGGASDGGMLCSTKSKNAHRHSLRLRAGHRRRVGDPDPTQPGQNHARSQRGPALEFAKHNRTIFQWHTYSCAFCEPIPARPSSKIPTPLRRGRHHVPQMKPRRVMRTTQRCWITEEEASATHTNSENESESDGQRWTGNESPIPTRSAHAFMRS